MEKIAAPDRHDYEKGADMESPPTYKELRFEVPLRQRRAHSVLRWRNSLILVFLWLLLFYVVYDDVPIIETDSSRRRSENTVIVGGGIIGLCTAYYLALALGDGTSIAIIDNAPELGLGASGQALGLIGKAAWSGTEELRRLSYALHSQLADEFHGTAQWSFANVTMHDLAYGEGKHGDENVRLPSWLTSDHRYVEIAPRDNTEMTLLQTREFLRFLEHRCRQLGVSIHAGTSITKVDVMHGLPQTVHIEQSGIESVLPCSNLVIAAGAWSGRVLTSLFPDASYRLPMDSDMVHGWTHLTIGASQMRHDQPRNAVYTFDKVLGQPMDLTGTARGEVYIGGYTDAHGSGPLPHTVMDVHANEDSITDTLNLAMQVLNVTDKEGLTLLEANMAYVPRLDLDRPMIAEIPLSVLSRSTETPSAGRHRPQPQTAPHRAPRFDTPIPWATMLFPSVTRAKVATWLDVPGPHCSRCATNGGVFVNTGHDRHGISFGPGSGKVMSEMILGRRTSVGVSTLGYVDRRSGARDMDGRR